MRIRPPPAQQGPTRWTRSHKGAAWLVLGFALTAALLTAVGIWYRLEGQGLVRSLVRGVSPQADVSANGLPVVHLEIGREAYEVLEEQWRGAVQRGILQLDEPDWLPARIRLGDKEIPAVLWLEGDGADLWHADKWPFRVRIGDGATILGMRAFSLHSPAAHGYLNTWFYVESLREAGLLAPRYTFVNVAVNGEDRGIYALQESPSKELFESQKRSEGIVVRLGYSALWRGQDPLDAAEHGLPDLSTDPAATGLGLPALARVDESYAIQVETDPTWSEQAVTALGLLRAFSSQRLTASEVFDAPQMGRYIAHANLWGTRGGSTWHSERFAYNPVTSRLEPLGYDVVPHVSGQAHPLDLAPYDDLAIMEAYSQEAWRISRPEHLAGLRSSLVEEIGRYTAALAQEFAPSELELPWDTLSSRQRALSSALVPPQTVHAYQGGDPQAGNAPSSALEIRVGNLLRYPVVLEQVRIGEHVVQVLPEWIGKEDTLRLHREAAPAVILRRAQGVIPETVTLRIPASAIEGITPRDTPPSSGALQIVTHLYGMEEQIIVDVQRGYPPDLSVPARPTQPSVEEALEKHPFLRQSERPGFLELQPGTWQVDGDLVLPDGFGLRAVHPVTLTFPREAILFSTGPLLLRGPDKGGVHLLPEEDDWAGIVVVQAGAGTPSLLENVEVRGTRGVHRDGWITTGGITFYESAVALNRCRISDSIAPDAIHVVRAPFEFADTEFARTSGDAFDGDFVRGRIEGCAFHDILGNAIDVSGSELDVEDVNLLRIYGTGVSIGASSVAVVRSLRAQEVGIAVSSAGLSYVRAYDVHILQAWVGGFAAHAGEMGTGPSSIEASLVMFQEDESAQAIVGDGSRITINGYAAVAQKMGTDPLVRPPQEQEIRVTNYLLGPTIRLVGTILPTGELSPGDSLQLGLYWQAIAEPPLDYTVFVHVLDDADQNIAAWDSMPRGNTYPTTSWPTGTVLDDTHLVPLPSDLPAGAYRVALGLYYLETGERLPVYGPDGESLPDGRIVLEQQINVR